MASPFLLLFLVSTSLLQTTSSAVYYVVPDDHYTTDNNSYTLQHYLNNTNKYFTSHTRLYFLPGQYYLNTDLIIQDVRNLSLTGNRTNGVINSVIKCTSPAGIVVVGSSNIVIANFAMKECGSDFNNTMIAKDYPYLLIVDCLTVMCKYIHSRSQYRPSGAKFVNAFGNSTLSHMISSYLKVWYNAYHGLMTNVTHTLHIESFQVYGIITSSYAVDFQMFYSNFHITVTMLNINFHNKFSLYVSQTGSSSQSTITIANCSFSSTEIDPVYYCNQQYYDDGVCSPCNNDSGANNCKDFTDSNFHSMVYCIYKNNDAELNRIQFIGCKFENITQPKHGILLHIKQVHDLEYDNVEFLKISMLSCLFFNIHYVQLILFESDTLYGIYNQSLLIRNATFSSINISNSSIINVYNVKLLIENVKFTSILLEVHDTSIIEAAYSCVEFNGYNDFSNNSALSAIKCSVVYLQENTTLNFSFNKFASVIVTKLEQSSEIDDIKVCPVQYISKRGNLDKEFQLGQKLNYSIVLYKNINIFSATNLIHCAWDSSSAFVSSIPLYVHQKFINSDRPVLKESCKEICLCTINNTYDCCKGNLGPFYAGETKTFCFVLNHMFVHTARIEIKRGNSDFTCDTGNVSPVWLESNKCKPLQYTVKHNQEWCELSLRVSPISAQFPYFLDTWIQLYTIALQPCPKGFSLHPQGYCKCDPILSSHIPSLTTCDIDHQTILRPANTWISAHTINNLHSYHVSLHCPFDYCLPHSSQLNLSTPDSQCQFNRFGVLCGKCQHGLSTMFGSSQCKHCSNIYLLIIIPIGIAGLVLVLLLFTMDLTVTSGDMNSFLLYINIVSINAPIFFPTRESVMYAFTSFANLDLGIETCFYDEMDDYAKMWLQLVLPSYLIFIATLLIITSRYSTTIQRLTARRALPVLATLFLLSYTKVLLTVSNVLFSYTSITHLPSNHVTLVWSVDANVPLFGVKFTILFITCVILFLILVPLNVVLIFTKKLSYFKVVTYFKPLLDAYQGPYKIRFHYWTGLQLLLRAVFFGLTALDRNVNLTVGIILIGVLIWLQERLSPFKSKMNNNMEIACMLNLLAIFSISLYTTSNQIVVSIFVSLAMILLLCIILWHVWNNRPQWFCQPGRFINCLNIFRRQVAHEPNHIELVNEVPEVAHNYSEFQEELIGI